MKKIRFNVARATTSQLIGQGGLVSEKLLNNPYFPDPSPSLADWTAALLSLEDTYSKAMSGSKANIAKFELKRYEFRNLMRQMIFYINGIASENILESAFIIASAGFDFNKEKTPVSAPTDIPGIKAMMMWNDGEILVKAGVCRRTRFYEFYISQTISGNYTCIKTQQQRNALFTGLESGKRYYFKVRGVNRAGVSPFSNVVWMFAA